MIKILYFGMIAEATGSTSEESDKVFFSVSALNDFIRQKYPKLTSLNYTIALNQTIVQNFDTPLKANDEVALLPPFAGG